MRIGKWAGVAAALAGMLGGTVPQPARAGGAPLGLYAGGFASWLESGFDLNVTPLNPTLPARVTTSGIGGGFMVGYDWAPFFDNWTVGAVADASFGNWGESFGPNNGNEIDVDFLVTMRGRVGYWVQPHLMPYFTAGIAWQGTTFHNPPRTSTSATAVNVINFSNTMTGWTIGGGLDWTLAHAITLNAEYLFADFGTWEFTQATGKFTVPITTQQVRLGVKIPLSDPEYIAAHRY